MKTKYLLIGSGRVSTHYDAYFRLLGLPVQVWSRRNYSIDDLKTFAADATHILCLISDPAIEPFLTAHADLFRGKVVVHASGSLVTSLAFGAHPLMTFRSGQAYEFDVYHSVPFIIEKGAPPLSDLMPGVPNLSFALDTEKKSLYHALCVMSGNFTTLLWQKAFSDFESKLSLPHEVLLPYLKQITRNLEQDRDNALTGPLARKDVVTVQKHLSELEGDVYAQVYRSFAKASGMEVPQ